MKYLFINSVYGFGSTGRIIADKCEQLKNEGHECAAAYGRTCADNGAAQLIRHKAGLSVSRRNYALIRFEWVWLQSGNTAIAFANRAFPA